MNRLCHTLGIPTIVLSIAVFLASIFVHRLWPYALALFLLGWLLQFIGHAFEGKPPEFFQRLAFPLRRRPLVVGQNPGQSLNR